MKRGLSLPLFEQSLILFGPPTPWSGLLTDRLFTHGSQVAQIPDGFDTRKWSAWAEYADARSQDERLVTGLVAWAPEQAMRTLADLDGSAVERALDDALDPIVYFVRHLVPLLSNGGTLTLVTSSLSDIGRSGAIADAVIAGGLRMLAKSIAIEFGPRGVRANSLHLPVDSGEQTLQSRAVAPETVVGAIEFLLSPQARFVSGADIQAGTSSPRKRHERRHAGRRPGHRGGTRYWPCRRAALRASRVSGDRNRAGSCRSRGDSAHDHRGGRQSLGAMLNVTVQVAWDDLAAQIENELGRLDALVNNAGIFRFRPLPESPEGDWKLMRRVNIEGSLLGIRTAMRVMTKTQSAGSVVNLSSLGGLVASADTAFYGTTKGAVTAMTRSAAAEGDSMSCGCSRLRSSCRS